MQEYMNILWLPSVFFLIYNLINELNTIMERYAPE